MILIKFDLVYTTVQSERLLVIEKEGKLIELIEL